MNRGKRKKSALEALLKGDGSLGKVLWNNYRYNANKSAVERERLNERLEKIDFRLGQMGIPLIFKESGKSRRTAELANELLINDELGLNQIKRVLPELSSRLRNSDRIDPSHSSQTSGKKAEKTLEKKSLPREKIKLSGDKRTIQVPFSRFAFFASPLAAGFIASLGLTGLYLGSIDVPFFKYPLVMCFSGISLLITIFLPSFLAYNLCHHVLSFEVDHAENGLESVVDEYDKLVIKHPRFWSIFLINLLFSWTVIGWIWALKMACTPGKVAVPKELIPLLEKGSYSNL